MTITFIDKVSCNSCARKGHPCDCTRAQELVFVRKWVTRIFGCDEYSSGFLSYVVWKPIRSWLLKLPTKSQFILDDRAAERKVFEVLEQFEQEDAQKSTSLFRMLATFGVLGSLLVVLVSNSGTVDVLAFCVEMGCIGAALLLRRYDL